MVLDISSNSSFLWCHLLDWEGSGAKGMEMILWQLMYLFKVFIYHTSCIKDQCYMVQIESLKKSINLTKNVEPQD